MLTATPQPGMLREARNFLPTRDGTLVTRPGARQVVAGDVRAVVPWGNRLLLQVGARLVVWDGETHDVGPAGLVLDAASFQALTDLGRREDRLYIADGLRPLWYLAVRDGTYVGTTVVNSVVGLDEVPIAVPIPIAICAWGSRLWVSTGGNFVAHCQADGPDEWNPLWTIDCQGGYSDRVVAIEQAGDILLVGLTSSIWVISGKSQFDFQRRQLFNAGVAGTGCLCSDGSRPWWMGSSGVRAQGDGDPLSLPVQAWFAAGVTGELVCAQPHRLLLAAVNGRGLAAHLDSGAWTEFAPYAVRGVWAAESVCGWYGPDGVWCLGTAADPWSGPDGRWALDGAFAADLDLAGQPSSVGAYAETWPDIPNLSGRGRALLVRSRFYLRGAPGSRVRYVAQADGRASDPVTWDLAPSVPVWGDLPGAEARYVIPDPVRCEAVPRLDGTCFVQSLQASGRVEILKYDFAFRSGVAHG